MTTSLAIERELAFQKCRQQSNLTGLRYRGRYRAVSVTDWGAFVSTKRWVIIEGGDVHKVKHLARRESPSRMHSNLDSGIVCGRALSGRLCHSSVEYAETWSGSNPFDPTSKHATNPPTPTILFTAGEIRPWPLPSYPHIYIERVLGGFLSCVFCQCFVPSSCSLFFSPRIRSDGSAYNRIEKATTKGEQNP